MTLGFIVLRKVINQITNEYWIECYRCIRKFYPENTIIIIDDNSDYTFVTEIPLENVIFIQSEYKNRGELLPYLYYYKNHWFEKAVILHDSCFLQEWIPFYDKKQDNLSLWHFKNTICSLKKKEKRLLKKCHNHEILESIYNDGKWKGCFGCMTVITYDFVLYCEKTFQVFTRLKKHVKTRKHRMCFERIVGILLYHFCLIHNNENEKNIYQSKKISILGNIMKYCEWGYTFHEYKKEKKHSLSIVKCWTGR